MSKICLGSNLKEVKDKVNSDIKTIIEENGGTINNDNSLNIKDIAPIARAMSTYIKENINPNMTNSSWLVEKEGKIYYQFPKDISKYFEDRFNLEINRNKFANEIIQEISVSNELAKSQDKMEILSKDQDEMDEEMLFAPILSSCDDEETTRIIDSGIGIIRGANQQVEDYTFEQWIQQKESVLEDIENSLKEFKRTEDKTTSFYKNRIDDYHQIINSMKREIKYLKSDKATAADVFSDVASEIDYLNQVVNTLDISNYDVIALNKRLDVLTKMFLNKGINGEPLTIQTINSNVFYVTKGTFNDYYNMVEKVNNLINNYEGKSLDIIGSIIHNLPLVQEHIRQNKLEFTDPKTGNLYTGEAAAEMLIDSLKELQDIDVISSWTLGAGTGAGVIGQIIKIKADCDLRDSLGSVQEHAKIIQENISELKRSGFDLNNFEQKDEFGVKNGFLVHKFSGKWFKVQAKINSLAKVFNKVSDETARTVYSQLMKAKKENEEVLDITKIKSIADKYADNPMFSKYFDTSESGVAEMNTYELSKRKLLGDSMYEELVKQQTRLIEEFEDYKFNNEDDYGNEVEAANPFSYIEHFNSENFDKPISVDSGETDVNGDPIKEELYRLSKYNVSFPKDTVINRRGQEVDSGLYSQDFKEVESNKAAFAIWNSLQNLYMKNINPTLRADGYRLSDLSLAKVDNYMRSAMWNNLSLMGKVSYYLKDLFTSWRTLFGDAKYLKLNNKQPEGVRVKYSNTIRGRAEEYTNLLKNRSLRDLIDLASKENITERKGEKILSEREADIIKDELGVLNNRISDAKSSSEMNRAVKEKENYIKDRRFALAKAIANQKFYSMADADIVNSTITLAKACAMADASKKSMQTINIIQNYIKSKKNFNADSNNGESLRNLDGFISSWKKANIEGDTNFMDREKIFGRNILNKPFLNIKDYSAVDKQMLKFLKNDIKNIDSKEDFNFKFDNDNYVKENGKYYIEETSENNTVNRIEIPFEDFKKQYQMYLDEKAAHLGTRWAIGSVLQGIVRLHVIKALALNAPAGAVNRIQGANATRMFAASERFGFDEDDLQNSKDYLALANIDRYITETKFSPFKRGLRSYEHAQGLKTFKLLTNAFGLIQNKMNEIEGLSDNTSGEGFSVMDWAVNFAEFHNQGEIILSVLQNTYLEKDGKKVPIFNGDTGEWIYKPGTLILKDEYRTPENVRIWENFREEKGKNIPNPQLSALFLMQAAIERSQGNYNDRDRTRVISSTIGATLMSLKRYLPEQIFNSYGKIDHDLITGTDNYESRKKVLFKYAPSTAVVLSSMGLLSLGSWVSLIPVAGVTSMYVGKKIIQRYRGEVDKETLSNIQSFKLAASTLTEILTRTIDRPLHAITRGKYRKLANINDLSTKVDEKLGINISEKDRKILSESAQEVSTWVYMIGTGVILSVALRFVGEALTGAGKGDDDDKYKEKMKFFEEMINMVMNRTASLTQDTEKLFNPAVFISDNYKPAIVGAFSNLEKALTKGQSWWNDEGDLSPAINYGLKSPLNPIQIPNSISDFLFKKDKTPISDPTNYTDNWWSSIPKTDGQIADKKLRYLRGSLKESIQKSYIKRFKSEISTLSEAEQDKISSGEIKYYADIAAKKEIRRYYSKKRKKGKEPAESSAEMLNRINYKDEIDKWDDGTRKPGLSFETVRAGKGFARLKRKRATQSIKSSIYNPIDGSYDPSKEKTKRTKTKVNIYQPAGEQSTSDEQSTDNSSSSIYQPM